MKRQSPLRLFSAIIAFIFALTIAFAAPPRTDGSSGPSKSPAAQATKPPAWTIPESESAYPALLMPKDHDGLNLIGYQKQTEAEALAKFAAQGYAKAPPDQAAQLEKSLQTNIGMRLDVAGKIIASASPPKDKGAATGLRYVVVKRTSAPTVQQSSPPRNNPGQ